VFDHDEVVCSPVADGDAVTLQAIVDGEPRATMRALRLGGGALARAGEELPLRRISLTGRYGSNYGVAVGDDLDVYEREGLVHPAVWPALANQVFADELVRGSWIHLRSAIRHHRLAPVGATATVHAVVVDRSTRRSGERAVADIAFAIDGRLVATVEHEAIIALPGA
jgi:hypothetical protein